LLAGFLFAGVAPGQGDPVVLREKDSFPAHGVEDHVVQGEALYRETMNLSQRAATVPEPARLNDRRSLKAGLVLHEYSTQESGSRYCQKKHNEETWFCLVPGAGNFFVRMLWKPSDQEKLREWDLPQPAPFEVALVKLSDNRARELELGPLRREILYQGVSGKELRLLYREYVDGRAGSVLSQELTYEWPDEGGLTVAVKGARVEVLEAGNSGIRYKISRGFE
jgi:hypothetical protein